MAKKNENQPKQPTRRGCGIFYEAVVTWDANPRVPGSKLLDELGPCTWEIPLEEIARNIRTTTRNGNPTPVPAETPRETVTRLLRSVLSQDYKPGWQIQRVAGPLSRCEP